MQLQSLTIQSKTMVQCTKFNKNADAPLCICRLTIFILFQDIGIIQVKAQRCKLFSIYDERTLIEEFPPNGKIKLVHTNKK